MRSPRSAGTRTSSALKARFKAPLSLPLAFASSSSARDTPVHAPRPGARARTSGATSPSGPSASRISSSRDAVRRVRTHVRSGTCGSGSRRSGDSLGFVRNRVLLPRVIRRGARVLVLEPVRSCGHDDLVPLLFRQSIFGQNPALVLGAPGRRLGAAARLLTLLLDELVGREVGKVVERLDARLAKRHQHRLVQMRKLGQRILDAKAAALLARSGLASLQRFGGAALQLASDLVVETLDRGDFVDGDVGDFLEAGEALRDEQLRQRLVDVELGLEHLGPFEELALTLLARVGLGEDVDLLGGQLTGESHVLAAATDREAELVVRDDDLDPVFLLVDDNAGHGRRLERIDREGREIIAPGDDVDLLALKLLDDRLHAAALHADAGADRIDRAVVADDTDLGAAARVAGGRLDLVGRLVNVKHFLSEQLLHEFGVGARQENLRTAGLAADSEDQRADAVADTDHLARDLLVAADDALGAAEVDDDVAELDPLDDAGDDFVGAVLEFFILALALGVADLLEDDLLGGLSGDAAELDRGQRVDDEVADAGTLLQLLSALFVDLLEMILRLLDDFENSPQAQVARLAVELGADVVLGAVAGAGGTLDRVLHRLNDDAAVDQLLACDGVRDREQLGLVRGCDGRGGSGHVS